MTDRDKLLAAIAFIRSLGAKQVQLRYSDDEEPDIWIVVAKFNKRNRIHADEMEIDASFTPTQAALRLIERLVDGHECRFCRKRMALEATTLARMPFDQLICWYQYDPELKVIRRGCE